MVLFKLCRQSIFLYVYYCFTLLIHAKPLMQLNELSTEDTDAVCDRCYVAN